MFRGLCAIFIYRINLNPQKEKKTKFDLKIYYCIEATARKVAVINGEIDTDELSSIFIVGGSVCIRANILEIVRFHLFFLSAIE